MLSALWPIKNSLKLCKKEELSVVDCAEAETGPVEQNRAWSDPQMAKGCMNSLIGSAGAGAGRNPMRKWQFPLKQAKTHLYAKIAKIRGESDHCSLD